MGQSAAGNLLRVPSTAGQQIMLLDFLWQLPPPVLPLAAAGFVVIEAALLIGIVLPGASALLVLGVCTHLGLVPLPLAMVIGALAALAGSNIAYALGRTRPTAITSRWLSSPRARRARVLLTRFGGASVFFGQWVVGARTLVPRLSAAAGLPYSRFLPWNIPAASAWASVMVVMGYLADEAYERPSFGLAGVAVAALIVFLVVAWKWGLGRLENAAEPGEK